MDPEQSITRLIGLARTGDPAAAERLWRTYFDRLVAITRQRLTPATRRVADEEDVALSAFASFWAGVAADRFPQLTDRTALWPLLVAITANKCTDLIRRETRQKRGGGVVLETGGVLELLLDREPPPEFAVQVADQLANLLAALDRTGDPTLRTIAELRMTGRTQAEIADELGSVRETVSRKLRLIELCWVAEDARDDE